MEYDSNTFINMVKSNTSILLNDEDVYLLDSATFVGLKNVTIRGGKIRAKSSDNDKTLLYFFGCKNIKISGVYIDGNHANTRAVTGVWFENCSNCIAFDCDFYELGGDYLSQKHIARVTGKSNNCRIMYNRFTRCGGKSVDVWGTQYGSPRNIFVERNEIFQSGHWGAGDDALFGGTENLIEPADNIVFANNYVDGSENNGIRIGGSGVFNCTIEKNTFKNCRGSSVCAKPSSPNIDAKNYKSTIIIEKNTCHQAGIILDGAGNIFITKENFILNQDWKVSTTRGFSIFGDINSLLYSGNYIDNTETHKISKHINSCTISNNTGSLWVMKDAVDVVINGHIGTIRDEGTRTVISR